jgi:hypothetical protein
MSRPEIEMKFDVDGKALAKLAGDPALGAPARTADQQAQAAFAALKGARPFWS